MLLSARRTAVTENRIRLNPWLRAPLFLSKGAIYYSAIESRPQNRNYVELITSVIDADDAWHRDFRQPKGNVSNLVAWPEWPRLPFTLK